MSENPLAVFGAVMPLATQDAETLDALAIDLVSFPRLQLCTSRSKLVEAGKIQMNDWAIISQNDEVGLGKDVDIVPAAVRPKAMDVTDREDPVIVYDPQHAEFQRINANANSKDKEIKKSHMVGGEFLVWVPKINGFATMYLGTPSGRVILDRVRQYMGQPCIMSSRAAKTTEYSWTAPTVKPATAMPSPMPESDEVVSSAITKFMALKDRFREIKEAAPETTRER